MITTEQHVNEIRERYGDDTVVMVQDAGTKTDRYCYGFGKDEITLRHYAPRDSETEAYLYPIPFDRSHETISRMLRAGLNVICIERIG